MNKRGAMEFSRIMKYAIILIVVGVVVIMFFGTTSKLKAGISSTTEGALKSLEQMDWGEMTKAQQETVEHSDPEGSLKKKLDYAESLDDPDKKIIIYQEIVDSAIKNKRFTKEYYLALNKLADNEYYNKNNLNEAIKKYIEILESNQKDDIKDISRKKLLEIGKTYVRNKEFQEAESFLEKIKGKDSKLEEELKKIVAERKLVSELVKSDNPKIKELASLVDTVELDMAKADKLYYQNNLIESLNIYKSISQKVKTIVNENKQLLQGNDKNNKFLCNRLYYATIHSYYQAGIIELIRLKQYSYSYEKYNNDCDILYDLMSSYNNIYTKGSIDPFNNPYKEVDRSEGNDFYILYNNLFKSCKLAKNYPRVYSIFVNLRTDLNKRQFYNKYKDRIMNSLGNYYIEEFDYPTESQVNKNIAYYDMEYFDLQFKIYYQSAGLFGWADNEDVICYALYTSKGNKLILGKEEKDRSCIKESEVYVYHEDYPSFNLKYNSEKTKLVVWLKGDESYKLWEQPWNQP